MHEIIGSFGTQLRRAVQLYKRFSTCEHHVNIKRCRFLRRALSATTELNGEHVSPFGPQTVADERLLKDDDDKVKEHVGGSARKDCFTLFPSAGVVSSVLGFTSFIRLM